MRISNILLIVVLIIFEIQPIRSQTPCTSPPFGPGCDCSTAEILCTPDEIDGFSFTMSSTNNLGGVPSNDLCPGNNGEAQSNNGNVPNNVNWFGFIAWCSDLTINVGISDCTLGNAGTYGVQMALFANCGWPWNPIECITNGNDACGNLNNYPTSQTFVASGLTVGNTYYFMLDGCGGSACTVSLDVVGTCGTGTIDPWTLPISGPLNTCVGANNNYMAENLDGATDFHWYLNGSPLTEGEELNTITHIFNAVGTYTLCVDVSNDPCIPESNPPAQTCIEINVFDANAGTIMATPNPACPGQDINWSVTGYLDDPNYDQYFFLTNSSGQIIEIFSDDNGVLNFDECGTYTLYSYNFAPPGALVVPVVGMNVSAINCNTNCCDLKMLTINIQDNQAPVFQNPPSNLSLSCFSTIPPMENLSYTDNCIPPGSVSGMETGSVDMCTGGTLTRTWQVTDLCNNTTTYTQTITVTPVPNVMFVNPPSNVTIQCADIPNIMNENLNYTNNGTGTCLISGSVPPVVTGMADECGGQIVKTWMFAGPCGNPISHQQTITVTPMPVATFINPPADVTFNCDQFLTFVPQNLNYNNGGSGNCGISGVAMPNFNNNLGICGGSMVVNYTFTDQCGRTTNHNQTVTVLPPAVATYINPPGNITINCDELATTSNNLDYSNGLTGSCGINGNVVAVLDGTPTICGGTYRFVWSTQDVCNRPVQHHQIITVNPVPAPVWVNPPSNITVNCDQIPAAGLPLQAVNNAANVCEVDTLINPIQTGSADACGGTITYTWTYTDPCQRTITHTQTVTVNPMPAPMFVNPPASVTVMCENMPLTAADLNVINNGPAGCNINATVSPTIIGTPSACGGSYLFRWFYDGQCQDLTYDQTITVTPAPLGVFQNVPANITVNCDQAPLPSSFPNLNIVNNLMGSCGVNASIIPVVTGIPQNYCGGNITVTWSHIDQCQRLVTATQMIAVQPAPLAIFTNVPPDITVACADLDNAAINLTATNNGNVSCLITATVANNRTGTITYCGGTLTDTWSYTDLCGRVSSATRTITVLPAPVAVFTSLPTDITVDCEDVLSLDSPLSYTNGLSGTCGISGDVPFALIGTYTACGGQLFGTWTFNDQCNRTISHIQNITVTPAPDPEFINPPQDVDLGCGGENEPPQELFLSNGGSGNCAIDLNAPLISITEDEGLFTNTWQIAHPCTNVLLTHVQITSTLPEPNLFTETPEINICAGQTFDLSSIIVTDLNNTDPIYTYHSIVPGDASNEVFPEVMPNDGDVYFIQGENEYGCLDDVAIYFLFGDNPLAGNNGNATICNDGTTLNLNALRNGNYDNGGSWKQINGNNLNISNPNAVNFLNIQAGTYMVSYIVSSDNLNCPPDTANFNITVTNKITMNVATIECNSDGTFEVKLNSNANTLTSNFGLVEKLTLDSFRISGIPQGQNITITGSSANNVCTTTLNLNAPNCDCPFIEIPEGPTTYAQCENLTTPIVLTITVPNNMQANWYDAPTGGSLLLSNSLIYNHTNFTPGIYHYFVETIDPATLCISLTRLEIVVEILSLPEVNDYSFVLCDISNDGVENFNLNTIHSNITPLNNAVTYHLTLLDAQNGVNAIGPAYSNISNPQTIYALATANTNCKNIAEVTLRLNASPMPSLDILNESCNGKDDGAITINNHNTSENWQYSFDNVVFSSNTSYQNLNAQNYVLFTQNNNGCKTSTPFTIKDGMIVNLTSLLLDCSNNGTLSDPNDDVYTITINVQNSLGIGGSYNVTVNGTIVGTFTYDMNQTFTIPASGLTAEVVVSDVLNGCTAKRTIGPLTPCSTDCIETLNIVSSICNDNGTPTDPSDDFYAITFSAEVQNGSSTNDYLLFIEGTLKGKFSYNAQYTVTTLANGNTVNIKAQDSEDIQCSDTQVLGPLTPCSDQCLLNGSIVSINCFNPGETPDESDDYYEIEFTAQLVNGGTSTTFNAVLSTGGSYTGTYGQLIKISLPANGTTPTILISDALRPECNETLTINTLSPCSAPCDIDVVVSNIICNNNGTNDDDGDDVYSFDILVSGNGSSYAIDELDIAGHAVGTTVNLGPFNISNAISSFIVYFESNINCKAFTNIQIPNSCSSCSQTVEAGLGGEISCMNPAINLNGSSSEPGTYSWILNGELVSHDVSISAGQPGIYYFTSTFEDGCSATDSVEITIDDDLPVVTVSRGHVLNCEITEATLMATATGSNLTYEWTDASGSVISDQLTITVNQAGSYFFRAYNVGSGCSSSKVISEVELDVDIPSSVIYARPTSLIDCVIKSIELYTDEEEHVTYTWRAANSDLFTIQPIVEIFNPDTYILIAIDTISGCESQSDIEIPEFIEYPIIFLSVDDTLNCLNTSVAIDATGTQLDDDLIYEWKDENNNVISTEITNNFVVSEPGVYYLQVSNVVNGCSNIDTVNVEIFENEINLDHPVNIDVEEGNTYQFNVVVNIPASEIKSITWSPSDKLSCTNCLNPRLVVTEDEVFTVTVEDIYGCKGMAVIRINSVKLEVVTIPNVISISSGTNNGFTLYGNDKVEIINYLKIFDRWGNLMFHRKNFAPNDPSLGWNGKINGKHVEQGVYVYVFEIDLAITGTKIYKGDLTVIR